MEDSFATGLIFCPVGFGDGLFIPMIKTAIAALACAALGVAVAPEAKAEPKFYANPEFNQGWSGASATGGVLDLHVGLEEGPFYVQLGPALATGGGTSEWGFTGKAGVSAPVSDNVSLYSEISAGKFDGSDTSYGLKLGSKLYF